jgi:MerR family mercuric resistance operon transcriptional regulator
METFTVGELAKRARVNTETLRYYEKRGLMPRPRRSESGYRRYSKSDVSRLRFIRRAQELGFSLKEILELLCPRVDPDTTCSDIRKQAHVKLANIDEKIRTLKRFKTALSELASACAGSGPTSECPILEYLELTE